jgi:exopolyphosphatase/guanosine-5'-triphosphate,3'-diphosphate pyrophosphatase
VTESLAAFDCGSNSTRVLVVVDGQAVSRAMTITRLSQGVDASGALLDEAMERTFATLRTYRAIADESQVERGLLVATSAVRDASNGEFFLREAGRITGVDARILSGAEEAALSYRGACADLADVASPTLIVDVGGGSTELAVELEGRLVSYSMQLGCVRVSERALGRDVVTPDADNAARSMIIDELERAFAVTPSFEGVVGDLRLVGLAGTVATLAALDARLAVYDRNVVHHRLLTRDDVQYWRDVLARETPEQRLAHPGMVPGREDVLVAGLYILDAVMERFQVDTLLSSENDILDGIVLSLAQP